jgi:transposase-like protein
MEKIPHGKYTKEFREEAVKLVEEENCSVCEAARRLNMPPQTLDKWVKKYKAGELGSIGQNYRPLTEIEIDLASTKRELALVKMERDFLKKAAAYFAKESQPGKR